MGANIASAHTDYAKRKCNRVRFYVDKRRNTCGPSPSRQRTIFTSGTRYIGAVDPSRNHSSNACNILLKRINDGQTFSWFFFWFFFRPGRTRPSVGSRSVHVYTHILHTSNINHCNSYVHRVKRNSNNRSN